MNGIICQHANGTMKNCTPSDIRRIINVYLDSGEWVDIKIVYPSGYKYIIEFTSGVMYATLTTLNGLLIGCHKWDYRFREPVNYLTC